MPQLTIKSTQDSNKNQLTNYLYPNSSKLKLDQVKIFSHNLMVNLLPEPTLTITKLSKLDQTTIDQLKGLQLL